MARPLPRAGLRERVQTFVRPVGADYLRTLRLTPSAGREIAALDAQYGQLGRTKDALIAKDREAARAAREALTEKKRAAS